MNHTIRGLFVDKLHFFLFRGWGFFCNCLDLGKYRVLSLTGILTDISLALGATERTKSKSLPWTKSTDLFLTTLFSSHYFSITVTKAVRFLTESCKRSRLQAAGLHRAVDSPLPHPTPQYRIHKQSKTEQKRDFHLCRFAEDTGNFTDKFTNLRLNNELMNNWMMQCVSGLPWLGSKERVMSWMG